MARANTPKMAATTKAQWSPIILWEFLWALWRRSLGVVVFNPEYIVNGSALALGDALDLIVCLIQFVSLHQAKVSTEVTLVAAWATFDCRSPTETATRDRSVCTDRWEVSTWHYTALMVGQTGQVSLKALQVAD